MNVSCLNRWKLLHLRREVFTHRLYSQEIAVTIYSVLCITVAMKAKVKFHGKLKKALKVKICRERQKKKKRICGGWYYEVAWKMAEERRTKCEIVQWINVDKYRLLLLINWKFAQLFLSFLPPLLSPLSLQLSLSL